MHKNQFIYPYFIVGGEKKQNPIAAMPGVSQMSPDVLVRDVEEKLKYGINKILLFGVNEPKTEDARSCFAKENLIARAIKELKQAFGNEIYVVSDVCLCAYTSHGHCGVFDKNGKIDNDNTIDILSKMALSHAEAGVDLVSPSDMMDGRIQAIRHRLDENGFSELPIMSYSAKFATAYYGPFREAAKSAPQHGDRKAYQMDFRNAREAMAESLADEKEGADILMVKPALAYLDIISDLRKNTRLPIACYNVSGEYSMVKNAAMQGLIDERKAVIENMCAFTRAGADIIISYHTVDILMKNWLDEPF